MAEAKNGLIPTFFLNQQILTEPGEICAYILKFLFWNPGSTSEQIENSLVSMRKLGAKTNQNINDFPKELNYKLNEIIKKFNSTWQVEVETANIDNVNLTYSLIIRIIDSAGNLLINNNDLMVKNGLLTIKPEDIEEGDERTW